MHANRATCYFELRDYYIDLALSAMLGRIPSRVASAVRYKPSAAAMVHFFLGELALVARNIDGAGREFRLAGSDDGISSPACYLARHRLKELERSTRRGNRPARRRDS